MLPLHFSLEFFPPKTDVLEERLWQAVSKLLPLNPDFVTVTYGAGGGTRDTTHRIASRLVGEWPNTPVGAHLTCVGHTRDTIHDIAKGFWEAGVKRIVALRGDLPGMSTEKYTPHPDGYGYAVDLVRALKKIAPFHIAVAAYPETHPQALSAAHDLDNLLWKKPKKPESPYLLFQDFCPSKAWNSY
jgi:methylenetetrahydrofolate reductase (NADPH)